MYNAAVSNPKGKMQRVDFEDCKRWLATNGFEEEEEGHHVFFIEGETYACDFRQPEASRSLALVASGIATAVIHSDKAFVFVREWGTWPSEESWPLFNRAMMGYGDVRPLGDAPGFLYQADEVEDLAALVRVCLISGWSAVVVGSAGPVGFVLTDDEWVGVFASSAERVREWFKSDRITGLDLSVLWEGVIE